MIGAPAGYLGSPPGAAYVFEGSGSTWSQQARLAASDAALNDGFGGAVALSGDTALIGAPGSTLAGKELAGAAYVFTGSGANWLSQAELQGSDEVADDQFGCSLALSGTRALVGASGESELGHLSGSGALRWALKPKKAGKWCS